MKLNFDAAVSVEKERIGVGVVARDDYGAVLFAASKTYLRQWNAEMGEAVAALVALELAHQQGLRRVIIEGDAQSIVKALKKEMKKSGHTLELS